MITTVFTVQIYNGVGYDYNDNKMWGKHFYLFIEKDDNLKFHRH